MRVTAGTTGSRRELGFADVLLTTTAGQAKQSAPGEVIVLQGGRTVPIHFRIETGIPGSLAVGAATASVPTGGTDRITATVHDLHGLPLTGVSVVWSVTTTPAAGVADATQPLNPASGQTGTAGATATTFTAGPASGMAVVRATSTDLSATVTVTVGTAVSTLSGTGTATLDGTLTPGEWDRAARIDFAVNLPEGGTAPATLFIMNDATNLYVAVRFARAFVDPGNSLVLEFDNNDDGIRENGDDALVMTPGLGFTDDFRTNAPPCPPGSAPAACGFRDIDFGGTNDGGGAFHNDGSFTVYEISHPLNSGDLGHDFALHAGDRVGMFLFLRMIASGASFPAGFGDTTFPLPGFLRTLIAS